MVMWRKRKVWCLARLVFLTVSLMSPFASHATHPRVSSTSMPPRGPKQWFSKTSLLTCISGPFLVASAVGFRAECPQHWSSPRCCLFLRTMRVRILCALPSYVCVLSHRAYLCFPAPPMIVSFQCLCSRLCEGHRSSVLSFNPRSLSLLGRVRSDFTLSHSVC